MWLLFPSQHVKFRVQLTRIWRAQTPFLCLLARRWVFHFFATHGTFLERLYHLVMGSCKTPFHWQRVKVVRSEAGLIDEPRAIQLRW